MLCFIDVRQVDNFFRRADLGFWEHELDIMRTFFAMGYLSAHKVIIQQACWSPKNWLSAVQWSLKKFSHIIMVWKATALFWGMSVSYDISFIQFFKMLDGWRVWWHQQVVRMPNSAPEHQVVWTQYDKTKVCSKCRL